MSRFDDKKYDAFRIFEEMLESTEAPAKEQNSRLDENRTSPRETKTEDVFYEIEYDSSPFPGVGKYVLKSQKIEPPVRQIPKDPIRELFGQMREIARRNRSYSVSTSRFYDKRVRVEDSKIFYEQGMLMKDFEDDYDRVVPYSSYFPYYQMMGYEQLRTYFSWRTRVRKGVIEPTSLSYAFLYVYELLGNIGAENPEDGITKLLTFWRAYRVYEEGMDKYVLRWMKDYHVYYPLPWSFSEFVERNDLKEYYPGICGPLDEFALFSSISKYKIEKSAFYAGEHQGMMQDCFRHTIHCLRKVFEENEMDFETAVFQPTRNMALWTPFKDALFYPWLIQEDRRVVLSEKEIYMCSQNRWSFHTTLTTESGRQLIGYIMKQTESVLRRAVQYKHKLSADSGTVTHGCMARLSMRGVSLEKVITEAVMGFYREATKTVVRVDLDSLERIRREALATQEKLIVPEDGMEKEAPPIDTAPMVDTASTEVSVPIEEDPWKELSLALDDVQKTALRIALQDESGLKAFADGQGIMLEVLLESINDLAMDVVGDSLMDEAFAVYEEYIEDVKGMVEES